MFRPNHALVGLGLVLVSVACDDKTVKPDIASSAKASASAPPSAAPPPAKPTQTYLAVNETALSVNGVAVPFAGPDAKARIVAELTGKPNVAGDGASVEIARKSRAPDVALVLAALKEAKATAVKVRTAKRDGVVTEVPFGYQDNAPGCSATAFIGKDISISVWPISGQVAKRFAKGMAGPDLTMGGDAFHKASAACDSPIAYVAGDASITWGLVFDLALAAKEGGEGGAFRAQKFGVPAEEPVPGRKVTP